MQQLQQALLDQTAAADAAETIRFQAGRIGKLEEVRQEDDGSENMGEKTLQQLQQCQDVEVMNALLEKRVAELEEVKRTEGNLFRNIYLPDKRLTNVPNASP